MRGTEGPQGAKKRTSTQNAWCGGARNGERAWPSSEGKIRELKVEKERRVTQKGGESGTMMSTTRSNEVCDLQSRYRNLSFATVKGN